jgi:DNA-binding CsgD family transcriptional regulator
MDRQSMTVSFSATGFVPEFELAAKPTRVALAIDDEALARALRRALLVRTDIVEDDESRASVIVADHSIAIPGQVLSAPVLVIGSDRRPNTGESVIQTIDPPLVLSAAALVASGHRIEPDGRFDPDLGGARLSAREKQVMALLIEGASNKLIARSLGISVHTAKFHVAAVLEKLGARNRADAVAIVLRDGLTAV